MLLPRNEVHVWSARLSRSAKWLPRLAAVLSEEERVRRAQFIREHDADLFALGRAMRRVVLGAYIGVPPEVLSWQEGPFGKPSLARALGVPFRFNATHSGDVVLMAVAVEREVGIDVEAVRRLDDLWTLARVTFSPREQQALWAIPDDDRVAAFFATWSRKEAVIKALGRGLSFSLDAFDVEVSPAHPPALLGSRDPLLVTSSWTMYALPEMSGYASSLIVEGANESVVAFKEWRPE